MNGELFIKKQSVLNKKNGIFAKNISQMKKRIFILYFLPFCLFGQVWDDFQDGTLKDFWIGDRDSFMVNSNYQLQLDAAVAGQAYLSTALQLSNLDEDREWSFWIRENFAPSANNRARFYLLSDRSNLLDTAARGYYLQFGESGSNTAVRLYRQQGRTHTLLCSATEGAINAAFDIRVKVIRFAEGEWVLYCSDNGNSDIKEASRCIDTTITTSNNLGLACYYTVTNRNRFYFDDIYCGNIFIDTVAPVIQAVNLNKQSIEMVFDEALDSSSLEMANFDINNLEKAEFAEGSLSKIILSFSAPLLVNAIFSLKITGISDLAGNVMKDTALFFRLYEPQLFDIVIDEIMARPSASGGLPNAEYIELYNRTDFPINLNGWQLNIGNSVRTFGDVSIDSQGFLLVTGNSNRGLFEQYGEVAYLSSLQITNAGQRFRLTADNGQLIHFVSFTEEWYGDNTKTGGGWSIEMIDCLNPCGEMENWAASIDEKGGTPCQVNSVSHSNLDEQAPQLAYVSSDSADVITVFFSEKMLPEKLHNKSAYSIVPNMLIDSVLTVSIDLDFVSLSLASPLLPNTIYTLYVKDSLMDCVGNIILLNSSVTFGLGEEPQYNDLIINEILFHPFDEGVNFVEIYNRSNKLIDLRNLRLSTYKKDGSLDTGKLIIGTGFQLFPKQYLVLTTQPRIVQSQYSYPDEQCFIKMSSFPTYNHGSGSVAIINKTSTIDSFFYSEDMHYPLLKSFKGVSLERINPDRKTQDKFNWHSAAASVGYATPGYKNSAYSDNLTAPSEFEVYPEIFSPDNDGYNDVVNISYSFPQPGNRASIYIYNVNGKMLKTLVNNELLSTEGYFTWDGMMDGNIKAPVGTYIFLIEYWNTKGEVKRVKKTCTLAIKYKR